MKIREFGENKTGIFAVRNSSSEACERSLAAGFLLHVAFPQCCQKPGKIEIVLSPMPLAFLPLGFKSRLK